MLTETRSRAVVRRTGPGLTGLLSALVGISACAVGAPESTARQTGDPHGDISCATCHSGGLADSGEPAVPAGACTESGCHEDAGPREVELAFVGFEHRQHGGDSIVAMGCSGCHTHAREADDLVTGTEPLVATVDACSFCHLTEQAAGNAGECRTCHELPDHSGFTSQGVEVPHEGLPWIEGGCVRCHYDVTEPPVEVPLSNCATCHADLDATVARGIGEDLHGAHTGSACVSCHQQGQHRIRAMSSAVALECADCHATEHGVALGATFPAPATCNDCHGTAHEAQQRMVLGLVEGLAQPSPSEKFMDGLTCRSCHVAPPGHDPEVPVGGSDAACVDCHRAEYATVAGWWDQGTATRLARVEAYVASVRGRIGTAGSDSLRAEIDAAARMLELVRTGGTSHNLPLSHRLMVEAVDRSAAAARSMGVPPPPTPDLGRQPRMGLCSYCHYRPDDPWLFQEMSGAFHREVMGAGR